MKERSSAERTSHFYHYHECTVEYSALRILDVVGVVDVVVITRIRTQRAARLNHR